MNKYANHTEVFAALLRVSANEKRPEISKEIEKINMTCLRKTRLLVK